MAIKKWWPPLLYTVPRGAARQQAVPVQGDPGSTDVRGALAFLKRSTDQTTDWSAGVAWTPTGHNWDPKSALSGTDWLLPASLAGHAVLNINCYYHTALTGVGTEVSDNVYFYAEGGGITTRHQPDYGPSAYNYMHGYTAAMSRWDETVANDYFQVKFDSGSDTSSSADAADTFSVVFDLGKCEGGVPKSKTPYHTAQVHRATSAGAADWTTTDKTISWDTEDYDTNGLVDLGTNADRITVAADMAGWSAIVTASIFATALGDQAWFYIAHYDSGNNLISRGQIESAFQGTQHLTHLVYANHKLAAGDYFKVWVRAEAGGTAAVHEGIANAKFNAIFFPPVEGLTAPDDDPRRP